MCDSITPASNVGIHVPYSRSSYDVSLASWPIWSLQFIVTCSRIWALQNSHRAVFFCRGKKTTVTAYLKGKQLLALQKQIAVTFYFSSKQLLLYVFKRWSTGALVSYDKTGGAFERFHYLAAVGIASVRKRQVLWPCLAAGGIQHCTK